MRIGSIGSGPIVEHVLRDAQKVTGVKHISVYSRNLERAQEFAGIMQVEHFYDDMGAFLSDPKIDTVYIAVPNRLHFDYAMQALQAGKHVIVEKPFTTSKEKAEALIACAQENNRFIFEAICNIHLPHFKIIQESLAKIAPIHVVEANFSKYSTRYDELLQGALPNVFNPEFAGGALLDLNIYNIHLVSALFGMPDSISYVVQRYHNGVDTSGILTLSYPDLVASLVASKNTHAHSYVQIQGEKGTIYVSSFPSALESVQITIGEDEITVNNQKEPQYYYEFATIHDIIEAHDTARYEQLLNQSYQAIAIADAGLRSIGIHY